MKRFKSPLIFSLTVLALSIANSMAEPSPTKTEKIIADAETVSSKNFPNADDVILLDRTFTDYNEDGTHKSWSETAVKILTEKGRQDNRIKSTWMDVAYGNAAFTLAEVIDSEGNVKKIDIASNSKTMIDSSQMEANIYDPNSKTIRLNIPELNVGDTLHYVIEREDTKTRVPNSFSDYTLYETTAPIINAQYTITAPEKLPLKKIAIKDEVAGTINFSSTTNNGTISYVWEANNVPRAFVEPSMPDFHTVSQRLLVSTIDDWKDLSKWYWNLCEPHLNAVTPDMIKKVQELTENTDDRQKQIENIFYFVSQKIRYMGITLEDEAPGYEPHDASLTFTNRYGVCRDKAALLVSMLRQAGFKAYPVIIHAGPKKDFEVPQPFFNHAVVAVENDDGTYQLMDPTDENTKDLFPRYLCDKSFIVAKPDGETLLTSPIIPAKENLLRISTEATVKNDDVVWADSTIYFDGVNDTIYRGHLSRIKNDQQRKFFESRLKHALPSATLESYELTPTDIRDTSEPLELRLKYSVPNLFIQGQNETLFTPPLIGNSLGVANFILSGTELEKREYPLRTEIACGVSEFYEINLNKSVGDIKSNLERESISTDQLKWKHEIKVYDDVLTGKSDFSLDVVEFSPSEYNELKESLKKIEYNNRKKLIFEKPSPDLESDADIIELASTTDYEIKTQNEWSVRQYVREKVQTYAGKKSASELKFYFNPAWENVQILRASVKTNDEVRELTEKEINLMDAPWVASAPRYPAEKILVANLPGVEVGSIIEYEVLRTIKGKPFFSTMNYFALNNPIMSKIVRITLPKSMRLKNWSSEPTEIIKDIKERTDTRTYTWKSELQPSNKDEANQAPLWTIRPTLIASSGNLLQYANQLNAVMELNATDQPLVDEKVEQLLEMADSNDEEKNENDEIISKIEMISDFVAKNIRAAGPGIDKLPLSAISPADETLKDGYGNATDRAVLIYSMLKSLNLSPEFVIATNLPLADSANAELINQPQLQTFNTPIVRVKYLDQWLYIDPWNQYSKIGTTEKNNYFVLTKTGEIEKIDLENSLDNLRNQIVQIKIDENGDAEINSATFYQGTNYGKFRKYNEELTPEERSRYFQKLVKGISQSAVADSELISEYTTYPALEQFSVKVDKFAVKDDNLIYFSLPHNFANVIPYTIAEREQPVLQNQYIKSTSTTIVQLPAGYEPSVFPKKYEWIGPEKSGSIFITSKYDKAKNQLEMYVSIDLKPAIIPVEKYGDLLNVRKNLADPKMSTFILKKTQ